MSKTVVYLSGPITGVEKYWEPFEIMDDVLSEQGYAVLNPARLPLGLAKELYLKICLRMIDCADVVYMLPGWEDSKGALLEKHYSESMGVPVVGCCKELDEVAPRNPENTEGNDEKHSD